MTGLHRRDISRLRVGDTVPDKAHDIVTKVIGQWKSDKRWLDKKGKPRALSFGSEQSEFSQVVRLVTLDITPASVLRELERTEAIERTEDGLKLRADLYIPRGDVVTGFKILADDYADLLSAVQSNVLEEEKVPHMHFRTAYDRVDREALPEIRLWLLEQGQALHLKARQFLSQFDLDINPKRHSSNSSAKVTLSSFSLVEEPEEKESAVQQANSLHR